MCKGCQIHGLCDRHRAMNAARTPVVREECQCEHESHFPERKTPGHTYGALLPRVEAVRTDRGTFYCCQRCRTAGHMLPK